MTWGKVSDRLHAHSKARRAREAMALWVLALSWSCDELTDGAIPADMPDLILPGLGDAMAERLVSVGLWERTEAGFRFHDWEQFQPSADIERDRRESVSRVRSEAGRRGAAKRWQTDGKRDGKADGKPIANGWQTDSPVPVPVPVPREEILPSVGTRAPEALALAPVVESKPRARRAKAIPADREPEPGTLAARVRDAIVSDPVLAPLVVAPGDLAIRLCIEGAYPGVDVLAAVRAAGAWAAGKRDGGWRDGRAGLLGWLRREAETVARTPRPAAQSPRPVAVSRREEPASPKEERKLLTLDQVKRAQRAVLEARLAAGGES